MTPALSEKYLKFKRLLLPLLVALALPTAVNASYYYLIFQNLGEVGTYSAYMKTLEGCEAALEQAIEKNNWSFIRKNNRCGLSRNLFKKRTTVLLI